MSLNWREIELIVSELPLKGSRLQGVTQHDFNAISFHFFHPVHRQWTLYTEVGTPSSRLHKLTRARAKLPKTQRFVQFLKANLVNCLVSEVAQTPGERFVDLTCTRGEDTMHLLLRFYSGAGANIIVTDDSYTILDLLLRRPRRGEASGLSFILPEPKEIDDAFPIRRRTKESFNEQIEEEYAAERNIRTLESLYERATLLYEKKARSLEHTLASLNTRIDQTRDFERYKHLGDLLSSNQHLIREGQTSLSVHDWESGEEVEIPLDPTRLPRDAIQLYYESYQRSKGRYENALGELKRVQEELRAHQATFERALDRSLPQEEALALLTSLVEESEKEPIVRPSVGLVFQSGAYTLLVGRNAKENDELLRRHTRGNDWWVHTRDVPGGYVFIKYIKDKPPPLEVLLDAAYLAILYSKAKKAGKAELYYTQVKYLRRAKGAKMGTVLPTQERNLSVTLDEARLNVLLAQGEV
ncbi:MAG: DUF814 domain-containing protein [Spirochaetales bacterium]|nr:DUF814 domain-containing protein [Spirochaetales bacterium]